MIKSAPVIAKRWIDLSVRLPSGWRIDDVLELPQFDRMRVRATRGVSFDSVDVPIQIAGDDLDGRIVAALTAHIIKKETP